MPLRVVLPSSGVYSWAFATPTNLSDIEGSDNAERATGSIESVIKVWLVADSLRGQESVSSQELSSYAEMIGRSDDWLAQRAYEARGGDASIARAIQMCGLSHTEAVSGWWSRTRIGAADLVRLGWCIADGRAAGPRWTSWLLTAMGPTRDAGAFGVIDGLKAGTSLSYMNGWTDYGDVWQVNCMAIGDTWVLAVMARYPSLQGLHFGATVCRNVTQQLVAAGRI